MRRATSSALQRAARSVAGRVERAHEGAVGIGLARPDMALVDMGVAVDEAGQHDAAGEVDGAGGSARSCARAMRGDLAVGDGDVGQRETVGVERRGKAWRQRGVQAGIGERVKAAVVGDQQLRRPSTSPLLLQRAFVPAPQDEMRDQRQHQEDDDAGERDQDQRREQPRRVEPVAGLDDARGEARRLARPSRRRTRPPPRRSATGRRRSSGRRGNRASPPAGADARAAASASRR